MKVKIIRMYEIYISKKKDKEEYITVVRDLETVSVLHVGEGKVG